MNGQNPVFIPGPPNIPDRLRQAMNTQTMDHRSPGFAELLAPLLSDLGKVFNTTSGQVVTFPASGTGGPPWRAAGGRRASRDQGRSGDPQRDGDRCEVRCGGGAPRDGWLRPPGHALRGLRLLAGLDRFPHGRVGRGRGGCRLPEGVHPGHRHGDRGLELCARSPELYSDTVSAVRVPEGFDSEELTTHIRDT